MENNDKILEVKDLVIDFKTDNGMVHAVRNISFDLHRGETLCIVGESGSGKSVTSKAIIGILASNALVRNGSIMYEGENLLEVSEEEYHRIRGKKIGMIFQDPLSSLNPIVRIGHQITEAMLINSNKLKIMYNDFISKEVVEYKNTIAKRNINVKKVQEKAKNDINNLKKDLAKYTSDYKEKLHSANDEERKVLDEDYAKYVATYKENINRINIETKEAINNFERDAAAKLPALKKALSERKKVAKVEVKKFKNNEKAKFKAFSLDWKERYAKADKSPDLAAIEELNAEKKKFIADFENKQKEVEANFHEQIAKAKENGEHAKVFSITSELENYLKEQKDVMKDYLINWVKRVKLANQGKEIPALKEEYRKTKEDYVSKLKITKAEAKRRAIEVMREVGIPLPEKRFKQYPFEFSGGMRQRIVIAISLIAAPEILICDEPTTALDVTIQAQILELIKKIQKERNISCIFITHDLGVVANMADRVAVMYAGKIVEYGLVDEIFFEPKHPYTWALLSSIPDVDSKERLDAIPGTPPNMIYPPKGDAFALRSKYAMKIDFEKEPPFFKVSDTHYAATWLLHPNAPKVEMPKIVSERIKNALSGVNPNRNGGELNE